MQVLFISSWFPNKLEPTNGNFVQRHAEAVSLLHDVEILHAIGDSEQNESYIFEENHSNGIKTIIVYYKKSKNPALNFVRRLRAYKLGFSQLRKPDLLHVNILDKSMLFAVYLKKKYQIPFVVTEHWSLFLEINRNRLSFATLSVARFIAKRASFIFPVSENLMNNLKELKIGEKFKVVGNVVDTNRFTPAKHHSDIFRFLHISNLIALKNPDIIIKTAIQLRKEFKNFQLSIGGDGNIERLNKIIKENKAEDFITTFGELTHDEVAQQMKNSDCFVLFSEYENLPCVLLESISSGIQVISTRVGGVPEIVKNNCGIIIGKTEEELYAAMKSVLNETYKPDSPTELHQYIVDNFSMLKIAEKFDEIYRKVV
ncbi:glycosyltransferase [Chryseobacterium gambrini]|uniref:glycosyltransferase n=1 Tax=Chryseobacterium gambrini TaxID=373672 RepID=UPI0022F15B46|nr:glycosyltransferase [Chryseobacterium gambrini]WBV50995.1 glycosyltransferase [Chryseobacterium gambrini]